ncbi:MAG: hypothetical protein FD180_2406 [Planctomycetota bacterium]|nr:MAG: hypothetical protein FD180_2406 [Planctomycetota bacterium]
MRARITLASVLLISLATLPARAESAGEGAFQEGERRFASNDYAGAIEAFNRALSADNGLGKGWGRRGQCWRYLCYDAEAIHDLALAIKLDPENPEWRFQKAKTFLDGDRPQEALELMGEAMKKWPNDGEALGLHARAIAMAGDVDAGLAETDRAFQMCGKNQLKVNYDIIQRLKGDWAAAEKDNAATIAIPGLKLFGSYLFRVIALVELKRYDDAAAAVSAAGRVSNGAPWMIGRVYLESTPDAGKHFNRGQALADIRLLATDSTQTITTTSMARAYFLLGSPGECLDLLESKGPRNSFEVLFWMGAAQWKLGMFAEARATLSDARRLNPYFLNHADRVEGLKDFATSVDARQGRGPAGESGARTLEVATWNMRAGEIENLVRQYRFKEAADAYGRELDRTAFTARKAEIESRAFEVKAMAAALKRLIDAVNAKTQKFATAAGNSDLELVAAGTAEFEFTAAGGSGKFPWACLGAEAFCRLALAAPVTSEERFGLGCLALDSGLPAVGIPILEEALKKQPALRKSLNAGIARRRGIMEPKGGYVLFRGNYVTPEDKKNIEKNLVLYEGRWITAQERDNRSKGLVLAGGKWVPAQEAELQARGFRKRDGKWLSREEIDALCSDWSNAWTEQTAHYVIKTNVGESFAKDLAALIEVDYAALREFYGGREPSLPKSEKMTLYAYRSYEDYRKYCVDNNAQDCLNAAGFARSNSTTVVGWNKVGSTKTLLQTMAHEAAHLYYYQVCPGSRAPSWLAEGMATYFEGFRWTGKAFTYNFVSDIRLPFVRDAMKKGTHLPLATVLESDALTLINKDHETALLYYAECWSLNYFLSKTTNAAWRQAYTEYRKGVEAGKTDPLSKYFPDMTGLEKGWIEFVKEM